MNKIENYNPVVKNKKLASNIRYRVARFDDSEAIAKIIAKRAGENYKDYLSRTQNELKNINTADDFNVIVAIKENQIVGYGRVIKYDTNKSSPLFSSPEGWYLLGMVINEEMRRKGIGTSLAQARFQWLEEKGVKEVFSIVSAKNLTSINLHKSLGFKKIKEAEGFLNIKFDCGNGFLFQKIFNK